MSPEYNGLWSDIGDWLGLSNILSELGGSNEQVVGDNIISINNTNSYIYSDNGCTCIIGLDNIVVVRANNNILIMNKDKNNEFKSYIKNNKI